MSTKPAKRGAKESGADPELKTPYPPSPTKRQRQVSSSFTQQTVANFFAPREQKKTAALKWKIVHGTLLVGTYRPSGSGVQPNEQGRESKSGDPEGQANPRSTTVAAFDFDGTIIMPKSGRKHGKDAEDWKWWHPSVPARLRALCNVGAGEDTSNDSSTCTNTTVVIFTNQGGLNLKPATPSASSYSNKKSSRLEEFKKKCQAVLSQLDIPVTIYAATGSDFYRKPRMGMWYQFLQDHQLRPSRRPEKDADDSSFPLAATPSPTSPPFQTIDINSSYFVGDAAGRPPSQLRKEQDFSSSDYHFASNIGIKFVTPEEFFVNKKDGEPSSSSFSPREFLARQHESQRQSLHTGVDGGAGGGGGGGAPKETATADNPSVPNRELVVFCGSPGAGKSTYFRRVFEPRGYVRVNQDLLKTREKCLFVASEVLQSSPTDVESVQVRSSAVTTVVDSTATGTKTKSSTASSTLISTSTSTSAIISGSGMAASPTSVVVDNTNPDRAVRKVWIDLARRLGVPVRCIYFSTSAEICAHNDAVRALWRHQHQHQHQRQDAEILSKGDGSETKRVSTIDFNPENRASLPKIAFSTFASRFEKPTVEEGFDSVETVDFAFHGGDEEKAIWGLHWT